MSTSATPHILILGGGYVGLYTAWGIRKRLGPEAARITVVEPNSYMTYQPLLPEVGGGEIEPRIVTVNLRSALKNVDIVRGKLVSLDVHAKTATLREIGGGDRSLAYDQVVFAVGAVTRTFPTPGLDEHGVGFKTVEEAIYCRDKVLDNVALAAGTSDPEERAKALTFVVVGGGYTGVEALTELSDLSKLAVDAHPELDRSQLRWVLIEALDRVAPEVGPNLSQWTLGHLRERGVDVRLKTTMPSCEDSVAELSTGERIPAGLIIWTAGMKPNPVLDDTNVPRGPKGHVNANARLQVIDDSGQVVPGAWAAGDCAQVPDLAAEQQPAYCPPNAQHAVRQAKVLAQNVVNAVQGQGPAEYRHKTLGTVATYGVGRGAAKILGRDIKGKPAWYAAMGYHGLALPTWIHKWRLLAGWSSLILGERDITSMGATRHPRRAFVDAHADTQKGKK